MRGAHAVACADNHDPGSARSGSAIAPGASNMRLVVPILLTVVLLGSACTGVYAPPSRAMPLETARAARRDATEMQIEGGGAVSPFHTAGASGGARISHGVTDRVTASVEGAAVVADGGLDYGSQMAYTGRAGLHLHPALPSSIALTGGVGGGISGVLGSWLTLDVGAIASAEGRYVTGFASIEGYVSQPLATHEVLYEDGLTDEISTTFGARGTLGVELYWQRPEDRRVSLLLGMTTGSAWDSDDLLLWGGASAGVRVRLD